MNTNIHIERLVLDGLPVASGHGDPVQAAIETQLTRLLAEHGLSLSSSAAVPHLSAEPIYLTHGGKPSSLGHQIAQALYGRISETHSLSSRTNKGGSYACRTQIR